MNLNMEYTNFGSHPPINLASAQLKEVIIKQFGPKSKSFNFQAFCDYCILPYLKTNNIGLVLPANTIYKGGLDKGDCARVREIIWDFIIERYLTIGDYDHDTWPYFSITERGYVYFNEYKALAKST